MAYPALFALSRMEVGRFAPSPTGPLHLGSLVAAIASYCQVKSQGGRWLVRIEDVDQSRCQQAIGHDMLRTLARYGFEWDDDVVWQSQRHDHYQAALTQLIQQDKVYACSCSRKEIADSSQQHGIEGVIYPGTCAIQPAKPSAPLAWRVRTPQADYRFQDALQGEICHNLAIDIGDFVLKRADGLFSYQLAVVVDDAMQQVTQVVRGVDLIHSTPRQRYLQQLLGLPCPRYAHIPLVTNAQGQKLSKQTLAAALPTDNVRQTLSAGLAFLNRTPPLPTQFTQLKDCWQWAIAHWQPYF